MSKTILLTGGIIIALVIVVGAGAYLNYYKPWVADLSPPELIFGETIPTKSDAPLSQEEDIKQSEQKPLAIREIHQEWAADYSRSEILVGASHNIFVAKILKQIGSEDATRTGIPMTHFSAEIIYNIKGSADGVVVLEQSGGYLDGTFYVIGGTNFGDLLFPTGDSAEYFLRPGWTYVLATRSTERNNRYRVNAFPSANRIVSQDSTLSYSGLRSLSEKNDRTRQLLFAYTNEVLFEPDIRHGTTWNSFQSLSAAEKQAVYDKIASFFPPPPAPTSSATSTQ